MNAFPNADWAVAAVAFVAAVLAVLSLILLWEGLRQWRRRTAVQAELRRLSSRGMASAERGGLLKAEVSVGPRWLEPLLLRLPHRHDIQNLLDQADVGWSGGTYLLLTVGLAAAFALALLAGTATVVGPLVGAAVGAVLPYIYLARRRAKRFARFEEHFPESIDLIGRAVRAGHAFSTGLRLVGEESPEPVAGEFRQVYEEQKFGLPLTDSLLALADRVSLLDVRMFVTAIIIQLETGGNLVEVLENLAHVIRERFRFRRQLRIHTAHGRMTGIVLASAPIVAGIGMYILNPDYISLLFTEPLGRIMLMTAAGLQLFGFLAIRRVMTVDV